MAVTPTFLGPDDVSREKYIFSTDVSFRFFQGTMDADTATMLVSIRGGPFEANPDYIQFEGTQFTIPNPSAYPEGLQLLPGANRIEVKSVLTNGQVSRPAIVQANLALDREVKAGVVAPSGISLERLDQKVKVSVIGIDDENVTGYNFYASTAPGGGLSGYKKINLRPVTSGETVEVVESLGELTADAEVAVNRNDEPLANPLFLRVQGSQVDNTSDLVQTDFDQVLEVPETVRHIRTSFVVQAVETETKLSFIHDRTAGPSSTPATAPYSEFNAIPESDPLYYAATALYVIDGVEYESVLSVEVVGAPIIVTPGVAALPVVSRQQIVQDTTSAINRARPEVDVKPGSFANDVFINPFSTEAERIRFIVGFLQAATSFTTLLSIDDPTTEGISISVAQSPYKLALKQAFMLRDDLSVQNMIDNAFDQLASRRGITRLPGQRARGEVTLYRTSRPTTTQVLPLGTVVIGGVAFQTTSIARISPSGAASYNPATGRWATTAFVQAQQPGKNGNVAPGVIRTVQNGPPSVQVINESALFGGADVETNRELAVRADRALASVDSGTQQGYTRTASDVKGILQVNVVEAGHPLMLRDMDPETGKHWGGKVDVWVRPDPTVRNTATLTDTFAFSFEMVVDGQFEPVGDISNLKFRAVNDNVTSDNPIIEMLDNPDAGLEFKVISGNGAPVALDLTGVQVLSADTIQLDSAVNDPSNMNLTDQFRGSYRFRTSDKHVFRRQPVNRVVSFYRTLSDGSREAVNADAYQLFHPESPLDIGRTVEAGDYLKVVTPTTGSLPEPIPSGQPIEVTNESHVMLSGPEYLNNLGINKYTVRVFSLDRSVEYHGPFSTPSSAVEFTFIDEDGEHPLAIVLTSNAEIVQGQEVLVDYQHDENYSVEYTTPAIIRVAQNAIEPKRHVTADVLVKEAVPVGVDISGTVVLQPNKDPTTVSGLIRSELSRLFGTLSLGTPLRQSDVVDYIENARGVSYVVIPLVKLAREDGAMVVREAVVTTESSNWAEISAWSTDGVKVYLLKDKLDCGTSNGGGSANEYRGVAFNDRSLTLAESLPLSDGAPLRGEIYSAAIIGNDGMAIPGYTGDTDRRVLVALPTGTDPSDGKVTVTYIVSDDTGVKNIEPGPAEYLVLGNLDFTFDSDTDTAALLAGR